MPDRRTWDDHLRARLPGLYRAFAPWVWRLRGALPRDNRLRRAFIDRMIRRSYAGFNRNDLDALLPMYADGFVWDWSRFEGWPDEALLRGPDALRRGWAVFRDAWNEMRVEPAEWRDHGDRVLIRCDMRTVGAGSGLELERTWWQVAEVRHGLVVAVRNYTDRDEAARSAQA